MSVFAAFPDRDHLSKVRGWGGSFELPPPHQESLRFQISSGISSGVRSNSSSRQSPPVMEAKASSTSSRRSTESCSFESPSNHVQPMVGTDSSSGSATSTCSIFFFFVRLGFWMKIAVGAGSGSGSSISSATAGISTTGCSTCSSSNSSSSLSFFSTNSVLGVLFTGTICVLLIFY